MRELNSKELETVNGGIDGPRFPPSNPPVRNREMENFFRWIRGERGQP